ncbi:hypothetical protein [Bacillus sp. AFS088145]|uniref:hypothetical protein n=1 Tax=Bacillus sp. AFS088145 TaxID=2033514 RepID=UPI000BF578CE|nr:hypothetical protein [Bacillus sp. AFS088145]PFH91387.1 hypothetical protein COI44_01925 [Bacillus sp. AFS088145]
MDILFDHSTISMMDRLDKTPFLGKKILLIGLEGRINDFRQLLDKGREIDFTHLSGDEQKQFIKHEIKMVGLLLFQRHKSVYS